ncbi:hypothetical protein AGMMS50255_8420 [Spirochaetia bacterium]|nr:hypothetical protein AGMMS50255_8420 [Spirochaetia bacterium]
MKGTVNRNSVLRIWLVSYLLVLIIPLGVSFMLYSTAMSVTRQNVALFLVRP